MHLARHPRVRLAHLPTPFEELPRLAARAGGPRLFVKRDDCTGLASGGNKTRKLEFLLGEAMERGADTVITVGAIQSNHVRQTAAAAARLGLRAELILERRVPERGERYESTGNVLLDELVGARLHFRPGGLDLSAEAGALAVELEREGRKPYVVPGGGSNPVGALGYVLAARELLAQADEMGIVLDAIVHATGSTGTQAGLLVGIEAQNARIPVHGISVRHERERQRQAVHALAVTTARKLGVPAPGFESVIVHDEYVGPGYGLPTPEMVAAVRAAAELEGLLFDPVYSGKGLAGLLDLIERGVFTEGQNVLFVHTGGSAALFAYEEELRA